MHNESAITSGDETPPYTDASRASWLIVSTAVCLSVTLMFVLLRAYVRAIVIKSWGADDTLVVISFILAILTGVIFSIYNDRGYLVL
ncbi:hypothetical protein COL26b_012357 [Colletotrichum chrysophilum]|uniref:uncharacterized protein n=1 Tax=Colletotrichum chrysophilum TaxID=1836956 RepID=UPI0022FFFDF6|nr:uncharacterized protein COL26b_012357 [Colletotrichum chrysophilum]KAJ0284744.1 hypothetical protein COL940_003861 [Colletotrichum noveboracense]KAJ0364797.1 hypothetical protein COL26b_012357 [Colletotrichum chrysophilum]